MIELNQAILVYYQTKLLSIPQNMNNVSALQNILINT